MEAMVFFVLEIDPEAGTINATSYSPYLDQYKKIGKINFNLQTLSLVHLVHAKKTRYLFSEDFSEEVKRDDEKQLMNGWTIVDEGTIDAPSKWSIVNGEVVQTSNIYGPNVPAVDNRKGTFAYYDKRSAIKLGKLYSFCYFTCHR